MSYSTFRQSTLPT